MSTSSGPLGFNPHKIPAGIPPPGVIPNLINPPNHTRELIIQHSICLTLTTLAVAVRLFTRSVITRSPGWDDYVALFAWAMVVAFSGLTLGAIQYGFGRHAWDVPFDELVPQLKLAFVTEIMYLPISLAIKTAFLLFFGRIFAVNNNIAIKRVIHGALVLNALFYIAIFFDIIFLCSPVKRAYNPFVPGHCQSEHVAPYLTGVWSFTTDLFLWILPLTCIWGLQVKREKKTRLAIIFSVGLFACIASVIRFAYTVKLVSSKDVSWNFATLSLWSVFEIHIGLICACLPAFLPFYEHTFSNGFSIKSYFSKFSSLLSHRSRSSTLDNSHKIPSAPSSSHSHEKNNQIMVRDDYEVAVVKGHSPSVKHGPDMAGPGGYRDVDDDAYLTAMAYNHGGERGMGAGGFAV